MSRASAEPDSLPPLPDMHLVLLPDAPRFTIAAASEGYASAAMMRPHELVGRGLFEVLRLGLGAGTDGPEAGDERSMRASLMQVLALGRADAMPLRRYEWRRFGAAQGAHAPRWWTVFNAPVPGADGQVACIVHRVEELSPLVQLHAGSAGPEAQPGMRAGGPVGRGAGRQPARVVGAAPQALPSPWSAPAPLLPPAAAGAVPLVLVVEDNVHMNEFIRLTLAEHYRVASALDGTQGLELALELRPELVVTDMFMPGLDGGALLRALRAQPTLQDTPIVVLSSQDDDATRVRMLREGAQDYLAKPFSADVLLARVHALLQARAATRALRRSEAQLRALYVQASDAIFVADAEGRCIDVNEAGCELLASVREDIVGRSLADLVVVDERERVARMRSALPADTVGTHEWTMQRKDGGLVPVEVSARLLADGRWLGFARDISARQRALEASRSMARELARRVDQRTRQLRRLAAELEAAENSERRQIARDLHDDLGQTLAAARIRLATLCSDPRPEVSGTAAEVGTLIDRAAASTRSVAAQLAPAILFELGLQPALEWLGEELHENFGLQVTVLDDGQPKPLSLEARSVLYRAVRELLINVAKHAGTDAARVVMRRRSGRILMRVSDAGVGFDPAAVTARPRRGLGLLSVRERLSFIGGRMKLRAMPGDGTVALLSAPLGEDEPEPQDMEAGT